MSNDNTKSNEYSQKILEAMDIIAQSKINSISFDKTITCTITNDEKRKEGEYEVSNGISKFKAYSQDNSYRKDDVVYVTIPEGNYDNQKMIIGKKTDEDIKPYVFQMPFDTIFDMTGNLAAADGQQPLKIGALLANDVQVNDSGEPLLIEGKPVKIEGGTTVHLGTLGESEEKKLNFSNYTRLGIKADFKTWVAEAVQGSYGLRLKITTEASNAVPDKEGKQEDGETTTTTHILTFNVSDMYGNPYNYETFYSQEKVFNISEFDKITEIKIYFYQNGDFRDKQGNLISAVDAFQNRLWENLYVDNLYLCLGYDINTLTEDYVEIFTQDSSDYARSTDATKTVEDVNNKNEKTIQMRWVHINDEGTPIDMSKSDDTNYQVRWYRYHIGAAAEDSYSGIYWKRIESASGMNYTFTPDVNNQQEKIKAIVLYNYIEKDETTNTLESGIPYHSNELEFTNQETLPPGQTAQHIVNALNIVVGDGSSGNYLIYGQDNSIKDTSYGDEIRSLFAEFDADNDGKYESGFSIENLNENNYLIWEFPTLNTMIEILNDEKDEEGEHTGRIKNNWPQYKISKYYSPSKTNNTITCQYVLNSVTYNSEIEFTFGPSGTMGTDQTLVIDFDGDTNAIDLDNDQTAYKMIVRIYDKENKELSNINNIHWSWYYPDVDDEATANKITINNRDKQICNLSFTEKPTNDELYIIKVKVGDLETYYPIALKSGDASYIEGPTQIIYMSDGTINYQNVPYKVFKADKREISTNWSIINEGAYTGSLNENRLKPLGIYVRNAPVYGVKCSCWTQPILVLQNRWSNNVLNAWDGKKLTINESKGLILANAISAGKKEEDDNSFTGVIIGDWSGQDASPAEGEATGVYGFEHGAMSYAFRDNGTAFIGKSGKGRIEFNGNKGIIQSASWGTSLYPQMQIDLDDTLIEMKGSATDFIKLDATSNMAIQLSGAMQIGLSSSHLGVLGELTANQGGVPTINQGRGIGLWLTDSSKSNIGGFKATSSNTGLYYDGGGYLSIDNNSLDMGSPELNLYADYNNITGTKMRLAAKDSSDNPRPTAGFHIGSTGNFTLRQNSSGGLDVYISADKPDNSWLECNIPANKQKGIYARFA